MHFFNYLFGSLRSQRKKGSVSGRYGRHRADLGEMSLCPELLTLTVTSAGLKLGIYATWKVS